MLKSLLIIFILTSVGWAESLPEQFVLTDGRVLIGTYDAGKQQLTAINTGIPVSIKVTSDQIVTRRPSSVPEQPKRIVDSSSPRLDTDGLLTKEQAEENTRLYAQRRQEEIEKVTAIFTERFKKPYIMIIPSDAIKTDCEEIPFNLRGNWSLMFCSVDKGDIAILPNAIRTSNGTWEMHHQVFAVRSVKEVESKNLLLGWEIDVKGSEPYFVRFITEHLVALTIGDETKVYTILIPNP